MTARVLTPDDLRCPVTGKRSYPTEPGATAALERAWTQRQTSDPARSFPRRVYLCECGWWHLSSHWSRED